MLRVYLTVDTEYSSGWYAVHRHADHRADFARSIEGRTRDGAAGIFHQMDVLEAHGLKAVFFVDPMPALVWGTGAIAAIVEPVLARGHDVQLHIHTEWLELADHDGFTRRRGSHIADFPLDDQVGLIDLARRLLIDAGAPPPIAFRAGNYGANDDTLRALAQLGIAYDSSFCPGIDPSPCSIGLPRDCHAPTERLGVVEVPIGSIGGADDRQRHAQLTALSGREMLAALHHAAGSGASQFTIVSHSFELLSRDRRRTNAIVSRRHRRLCEAIAASPAMTTATYVDSPPAADPAATAPLLPHSPFRTAHRLAEQAAVNLFYGGRR